MLCPMLCPMLCLGRTEAQTTRPPTLPQTLSHLPLARDERRGSEIAWADSESSPLARVGRAHS